MIKEYKESENDSIHLDLPCVAGYHKNVLMRNIIENTKLYIDLLDVLKCKCKVLFSVNENIHETASLIFYSCKGKIQIDSIANTPQEQNSHL
jgi:hypothetical protein